MVHYYHIQKAEHREEQIPTTEKNKVTFIFNISSTHFNISHSVILLSLSVSASHFPLIHECTVLSDCP